VARTQKICTLALLFLLVTIPAVSQFSRRGTPVPFGDRASSVGVQNGPLTTQTRAYERFVASGNDRAAAQAAFSVATIYERGGDYPNAASWYRTSYAKGGLGGSKGLVDLVLTNRISINKPENIRPFVEVRAICGSHIARVYVLEHWHEAPSQIPEYPNQKLTECGPVGPEDRMEPMVMNAARRAQNQQQLADFYRQHPDQDPNVEARKAAEGAALLLGALLIQGAAMPASGPGSVACNKYQNHYPGNYDGSVCDVPTPQK
jgi:hypothetical protein